MCTHSTLVVSLHPVAKVVSLATKSGLRHLMHVAFHSIAAPDDSRGNEMLLGSREVHSCTSYSLKELSLVQEGVHFIWRNDSLVNLESPFWRERLDVVCLVQVFESCLQFECH